MKMSYYWFNRKEKLQKAKKKDILKKKLLSIIQKTRSNKEKVKASTQNLVKRRKKQNLSLRHNLSYDVNIDLPIYMELVLSRLKSIKEKNVSN